MHKKILLILLLLSILIVPVNAVASTGFDVVQDSPGVVKQDVLRKVQEKVDLIQRETPNYEFHLILIPADINQEFKFIRNEIFKNYINADRKLITIFLVYKLSDNDYQFIIDPDIKEKISPAYLTHIMETGMLPKLKNKQYDEAIAEYIPRLTAYFALVQKLPMRKSQQDALSSEVKVIAEHFDYRKPVFEEIKPITDVKPIPQNTRGIYYLAGSLALLISIVGAVFWWRKRKKKRQEAEYEDEFEDTSR